MKRVIPHIFPTEKYNFDKFVSNKHLASSNIQNPNSDNYVLPIEKVVC